jgi:TPR repeat protein
MNNSSHDHRLAALAASEADQLSEAYRLWLPFAEAGDVEAQSLLGSLMQCSLHRYESFEQLNSGTGPIFDETTTLADRNQGARFLEAASAAGHGVASFNLAALYVSGYGGGSWEVRKARAAELYTLAYSQGFTSFGSQTQSKGLGQPYLDMIELYTIDSGLPLPGQES